MANSSFRFGSVGTPRSRPKRPGGSVGTIMHLAGQDLHALELGWVRAVRVTEKTCENIRLAAETHDVAISIHAPYYINLNADETEWPRSRKRLMDAAHFGHLAGATDIVFHPGSYFEQTADQVLEIAIPRLQDCANELEAADNPVRLRPETMGKGALLGSLEDTLTMATRVQAVEPCLDFAHLHAREGDGTMNSYEEWCQVFQTYEDALGRDSLQRLHCHLSGIAYTEKGEQNHLLLDESDFDLNALLQALKTFQCGGRILCESPQDMDVEAQKIKTAWLVLQGDERG